MKRILLAVFVLALSGAVAFAANSSTNHQVQLNVPEVVLIGLNSGVTITLNVVAPGVAGNPPTGQTDNSKVLYYTAVNAGALHRNITVNWGGADAAPAGTSLHVVVTGINTLSGNGGTAGAAVQISNVAQNIVTGITSCYTGTGGGNGAALTYTLQVDTPGSLVVGDNHLVTVTFTLTDAS